MHPENEPPTILASDSWWSAVLVSDRRRKRIRRAVGNVLAFALTFAAFTALLVLVRFVEC